MMNIPFSPPDITEAEINEVAEALRSGWITTGPRTKELERQVAAFCGTERAVCLNSQTACAEMALHVLGVKAGDEVITSVYTYTASASVICHVGATPVLVDTQSDCLEMDYDKLEAAIGNTLENAIWTEFGTGEYALNNNGRKTAWRYQDAKGNWYTTTGKKPIRMLFNAFVTKKNAVIRIIEQHYKDKLK